jgi:hypothetical protein
MAKVLVLVVERNSQHVLQRGALPAALFGLLTGIPKKAKGLMP